MCTGHRAPGAPHWVGRAPWRWGSGSSNRASLPRTWRRATSRWCTRGEADEARSVAVEPLEYRRESRRAGGQGMRRQEATAVAGSPRGPRAKKFELLARSTRLRSSRVFSGGGRAAHEHVVGSDVPELENVPSKVFGATCAAAYELATIRRGDRARPPGGSCASTAINSSSRADRGTSQAWRAGWLHRRTSVTVEVTIERISWDRVPGSVQHLRVHVRERG